MELRQLRYLVALAEERSFTRAASKVLVAQPALSQQVAKLETELGVPLVDRTTRRVGMTEAGERLVEHARRGVRPGGGPPGGGPRPPGGGPGGRLIRAP